MNKTTLLITTALVGVAIASPSFAAKKMTASNHKLSAAIASNKKQPVLAPGAKVKGTVLNTSSFFGTTFSGFSSAFASLSVTSKKAGTLSISAMEQLCNFGPLGIYAGAEATDVVVNVDGSYVDGGPFQAPLNSGTYCIADNWQGIWAITSGSHTVEFRGYLLGTGASAEIGRTVERIDTVY